MLTPVALPLAVTGDEWIALAGVSSGVIVGVGGLVFAYFNARSERSHGERLARSGRLHEQRLDAYKEVARLLQRQRLYLARTEPIVGPKPDPPPPLDDDDWAAVSGLAAVSPSAEVLEAMDEAAQKTSGFEFAVFRYRQVEARPTAFPADEGLNARKEMDQARDDALEAISEAQRRMREELAEL